MAEVLGLLGALNHCGNHYRFRNGPRPNLLVDTRICPVVAFSMRSI